MVYSNYIFTVNTTTVLMAWCWSWTTETWSCL